MNSWKQFSFFKYNQQLINYSLGLLQFGKIIGQESGAVLFEVFSKHNAEFHEGSASAQTGALHETLLVEDKQIGGCWEDCPTLK